MDPMKRGTHHDVPLISNPYLREPMSLISKASMDIEIDQSEFIAKLDLALTRCGNDYSNECQEVKENVRLIREISHSDLGDL